MFRMNTYKNKGLKVPLESTLTEKGGGGTPNSRKYGESDLFSSNRSEAGAFAATNSRYAMILGSHGTLS